MVAIFEIRRKVSDNTRLYFRLLSSLSRSPFLALLLLAPLSLFAQGGPPLLTDDPGTPGRNNWEINLGYTIDRQSGYN